MYEIEAVAKLERCPECGVVGLQTAYGYKTRYISDLPNSGMQGTLKLRVQIFVSVLRCDLYAELQDA